MKDIFYVASAITQETKSNFTINVPAPIRSIMGLKKGDEIEFVAYADRSIEIRLKAKE